MGFLDGWRSCPRCAGTLLVDGGRAECAACASVYYAHSAPAASALIVDEQGRMLLARRAHEPDAGRWDVLGGFLEEGEDPLEALRRELLEETGLQVEPDEYVGAYVDTYGDGQGSVFVLNLVWRAHVVAGEPVPADDVAELRWFSADELPGPEECAFRWVAPFLRTHAPTRP